MQNVLTMLGIILMAFGIAKLIVTIITYVSKK